MANEEKSDQAAEKSYVLAGSLIGASIGFLSKNQASRSLLKKVGQSEAARTLASQARMTVQDIVMEQLTTNLKSSVTSYLDPREGAGSLPEKLMEAGKNSFMKSIGSDGSSSSSSSDSDSSEESEELERMKKENEELNDRLNRMEEMLSKFVDSQNK